MERKANSGCRLAGGEEGGEFCVGFGGCAWSLSLFRCRVKSRWRPWMLSILAESAPRPRENADIYPCHRTERRRTAFCLSPLPSDLTPCLHQTSNRPTFIYGWAIAASLHGISCHNPGPTALHHPIDMCNTTFDIRITNSMFYLS